MALTLEASERVLAIKFAYRLADPERGNLAVVANPEAEDEHLIKRIVALKRVMDFQ